MRIIAKTASYGVMHIVVSFLVAWAVSRDIRVALGISLIEPAIQIGAFYFHEKIWTRLHAKNAQAAAENESWDMVPPCCRVTADIVRHHTSDKKQ